MLDWYNIRIYFIYFLYFIFNTYFIIYQRLLYTFFVNVFYCKKTLKIRSLCLIQQNNDNMVLMKCNKLILINRFKINTSSANIWQFRNNRTGITCNIIIFIVIISRFAFIWIWFIFNGIVYSSWNLSISQ